MFRKLVKALIPRELFRTIEPAGHLMEAIFWQVVLGFPAQGLKVIGVTGTDGKTTTSTLIYTMMNEAGRKTGLMTTIGYGVPGDWHENFVHMTTMPTKAMLERIKGLRKHGIKWLVLETTSHALAQNRVWGVPYTLVVMTNLTHEHLDYHGTFENYRAAKVKLFKMAGANWTGLKTGVVNADDASAPYFAAAVPKVVRYGVKAEDADVRATRVHSTADGSGYEVKHSGGTFKVKTGLPGTFNVYNTLAAVAVGLKVGLTPEQIERGIAAQGTVEGRMTRIDEGQDFAVIVDFAHTPGSFDRILSSMREITSGRLIVMFGSAGRRDETKRGQQGALAGKWADVVVVTEEDDRDVDGMMIMEQIAAGAEREGKKRDENLFLVHDRIEAIRFTVGRAQSGDTVLLLGKGHEKTIERADGEHPWDEPGAAHAAVRERLDRK